MASAYGTKGPEFKTQWSQMMEKLLLPRQVLSHDPLESKASVLTRATLILVKLLA